MGIGQIVGGVLALRWRPRRPLLVVAAGLTVTAFPTAFLVVARALCAAMLPAVVAHGGGVGAF